jgi:DNA-binding NtrC family response regulator
MRDLVSALEHLARYRCPVLILGESGTGKKVIAEILHTLGPHPESPLIKFDCGDLRSAGAAQQLFGAAVNSFGGTPMIDPGYFQLADGGSLLLDKVGDLPIGLQGKLMRAVENLEIQPVGSSVAVYLDVRLIASTNHDLTAMVQSGRFRPDLYYRLAAASLTVPPLRERQADLEPLIAEAISSCNRLFGTGVYAISAGALGRLRAYRWPGNLRELAQAIECAMLLCDGDRIGEGDLPRTISSDDLLSRPSARPPIATVSGVRMSEARSYHAARKSGQLNNPLMRGRETTDPRASRGTNLDDALREAIERALAATSGDQAKAAVMVGVSRTIFHQKMKRYGLTARNREQAVDGEPNHQDRPVSGSLPRDQCHPPAIPSLQTRPPR